MALAATKTWQFTSRIFAYENDSAKTNRNYHWGLKDIFTTMGWTVEGGRTAANGLHNNDQVDVMPTADEADFGSGDIWMHLKAPVASPILAEFAYGSHFSSGHPAHSNKMVVQVSTGAGFGTVNGGSNGTTSTGPSASDVYEYATWGVSTTTVSSTNTLSMYGAWTTDSKHYRVMMFNNRVLSQWHTFDVLDNPRADLDDADVVHNWRHATGAVADPGSTVMDQDFYTSPLYHGRFTGVNRDLYLGTQGYANLGLQSLNIVLGDNKVIVHPCDVYNNTTGEKGYVGTIPDMYYGINDHIAVLLGDTVGGAANWFSGGSIVTPWDPTEPLPRVH